MGDASPADAHGQDATVDSGDALLADAQQEDSPVDAGEAGDSAPLTCDVGYLYCCFNSCWCYVPLVTTRWVACGADAEAGACPDAQMPSQCFYPESATLCPGPVRGCSVLAGEAGAVEVECTWGMDAACGRRPRGFTPDAVRGTDPTVAYLSRCAQLEEASIDAFEILHVELQDLGAPRRLVRAARRAARDEIRHAATMAGLAGRRGATTERRKVKSGVRRSSQAIAIENAVEGCVRETYGALVAMWQGRTAEDLRVRRAMRRIGADEAQHAQLAWNVHGWMNARLTPSARRAIERARHDALRTLRAELQHSPPGPVVRSLGLPSKVQATILLDRLAQELTAWGVQGPPLSRRRLLREPRTPNGGAAVPFSVASYGGRRVVAANRTSQA